MSEQNDLEDVDDVADPRITLGIGVVSMIAVLGVIGVQFGVGLALSVLFGAALAAVWLAWRIDARYGGVLP